MLVVNVGEIDTWWGRLVGIANPPDKILQGQLVVHPHPQFDLDCG